MTKGIFLCAFGKRGYGFAAYNFALSIKHFNPDLKIALYYEPKTFEQVRDMGVFDILIPIDQELLRNDPATIKTSCYDKLPFDYNLFLDVDSLALNDLGIVLDELILKGGYYYSHIVGKHTIDKGNDITTMLWAWANDIWEHFNLLKDDVLPATNSSFQFIKKCSESEFLFAQIKENISNPIPTEKLRMKWGGGQPDELYLNITLAQIGITGETERDYLFLGSFHRNMNYDEILSKYFILSLFGNGQGKSLTPLKFLEWYDRLMLTYCRKKGIEHHYKVHHIMADKHANTTSSSSRNTLNVKPNEPLISVIIPCKKRLKHVMRSLPSVVAQNYSNLEIIFVDYNCPQKSGQWVSQSYGGKVKVINAEVSEMEWGLSEARNLGYKNSHGSILVFMDADSVLAKQFITYHFGLLNKGEFLSGRSEPPYQCSGCCMVWRDDFEKAKGYNEVAKAWGQDDIEFYNRLKKAELKQKVFNFSYLRNIPHENNIRNEFHGNRDISETNHENWQLTEKEFKGI